MAHKMDLVITVGDTVLAVSVLRYRPRIGTMETPPEPEEYDIQTARVLSGPPLTLDDLYGDDLCDATHRACRMAFDTVTYG